MDERLAGKLSEAIDRDSRAAIACLVAAERAVEEGRFNVAKVLRAAAHTARVRAMNFQRLLVAGGSPIAALEAERERQRAERGALDFVFTLVPRSEHRIRETVEAAAPLAVILDRALESLRTHRDVMESDVAQSLWGCHECGHIAEGDLPDSCPRCGALGAEFEWFGPFYAATAERLGRRRPEEVVRILQQSTGQLARAFERVAEEVLAHRPSPTEWCMKEIAGHMLDVTELFSRRVQALREPGSLPSLDTPIPPWKLLEGKGYPETPGQEIIDRFCRSTEEALSLLQQLHGKDWARQGVIRGRTTNVLDLGTWLANHNVAHLKQIEALRDASWSDL